METKAYVGTRFIWNFLRTRLKECILFLIIGVCWYEVGTSTGSGILILNSAVSLKRMYTLDETNFMFTLKDKHTEIPLTVSTYKVTDVETNRPGFCSAANPLSQFAAPVQCR